MAGGELFIVGTPIGNLEDITLRALRVLREADLIAAEDTRRTGQLLAKYEINKPQISYHEFNEARRTEELLQRLCDGQRIALVSDAGMPTLSDPGQRLIGAAYKASIPVEVIPGVSAITTAVTASGIKAGQFLFYGFLPNKSSQRRKILESLTSLPYTLVFFESPYRIQKSLGDMHEVLGNRHAVLAREMTKRFEEFLRGNLQTLLSELEHRTLKGEITIVIEGQTE